ncbi:L-serine ammonia-lyase [Balneatrix alpica]|uniref:L-serine dehydratase n=1 Tax=Balneatrix alpica TaxID=75684 RepID=A0ABV5Z6U8_9GAMM|nr:L-serine ammonia-lyase [Balneatrix alpica]
MSLSVFDLFKIGVGPSSSHTVGPMWAAYRFLDELRQAGVFAQTKEVKAALFGSLAMTGQGHATDTAVLLGLMGERPDLTDPDQIQQRIEQLRQSQTLQLGGEHSIPFDEASHLQFMFGQSLPKHPNAMQLRAFDEAGIQLYQQTYYSVGGGFVLSEPETENAGDDRLRRDDDVPYPFRNAAELLQQCKTHGLSIAALVMENEKTWRSPEQYRTEVLQIWQVMDACIRRGCRETGVLPGGLNLKRRAAKLYTELTERPEAGFKDQLTVMDWVNLYAMAVNEENAAGGRVVTAPTNGAAGVIPAVLAYYDRFVPHSNEQGIITFLTVAAAIGMLYKRNASISAAEVGCQGEIGVACSMAAGALCAAMGGSNEQIENAAEIGMEHNLGLTCDPIKGLVQVPCIERNTMGAIKAINAARLALRGTGEHHVSLDSVIETMRQTGVDMQDKYKETATGGLAVNVVNC